MSSFHAYALLVWMSLLSADWLRMSFVVVVVAAPVLPLGLLARPPPPPAPFDFMPFLEELPPLLPLVPWPTFTKEVDFTIPFFVGKAVPSSLRATQLELRFLVAAVPAADFLLRDFGVEDKGVIDLPLSSTPA